MTHTPQHATDKYIRFAEMYLSNGFDAKGAYLALNPHASDDQLRTMPSQWLNRPGVRKIILAARDKALQSIDVSAERIVQELACIAFFDIADVVDNNGDVLPINEMPPDARRALEGIDITALIDHDGGTYGQNKKLKISNKKQALELLGKTMAMFTDKIEHAGEVNHNLTVSAVNLEDRIAQLTGDGVPLPKEMTITVGEETVKKLPEPEAPEQGEPENDPGVWG